MSKVLNINKHKQLRRNLRKNQTPQEKILWSKLRNRQFLGIKFYRQYGIQNYIVDFCSPTVKLIIEIDGSHHACTNKDKERDFELEKLGFKVLRFWNADISRSIDNVIQTIVNEIQTPPSSPLKLKRGI